MKTVKIDVTKIEKEFLFKGEKGTYLDLVLIEKPDQYGNDGFVKQGFPQAERERRVREQIETPIIGNWRRIQSKAKQSAPNRNAAPQAKPVAAPNQTSLPATQADDDVPF